MELSKTLGTEHLIYDNTALGFLIAIDKADQKIIKKFWKKYKGKSIVEADVIEGYRLVQDDEQDSLKIDFSERKEYLIRDLVKFG
ncbi:MAG: hypothetical protein GQ574_27210 [Crocinitomix sp.]|nr:hypothetical protein [Crocinitomix sp.]